MTKMGEKNILTLGTDINWLNTWRQVKKTAFYNGRLVRKYEGASKSFQTGRLEREV